MSLIYRENDMYLLTEWEGRTGKYLARGQGVRTERSEVRTSWPRARYFTVRPDLTQSISILSYDHLLLKIWKFCLNLNRTRLHKIRRPRARNNHIQVSITKICHLFLRAEQETLKKNDTFSHFCFSIAIHAKKPTEGWHQAVKNVSKPSKT